MTAPQTLTYTPVARALHWLIAALIVVQYVLAELAEGAGEETNLLTQLALLAHHKSIGITVLVLAVVRLLWRWRHPAPELPDTITGWQRQLAHGTHWAFYLLLFALPLSGWLLSSASAYSVSWFNLFQLPDLIGSSESAAETLAFTHEWLGKGLFALGVLHVVGALRHLFSGHGEISRRMLSGANFTAFVLLMVVLLATLLEDDSPTESSEATPSASVATQETVSQAKSELPTWQIDYNRSRIQFSGTQAGADFSAKWSNWEATVSFDPDHLADSFAHVVIQTNSADSADSQRDTTIAGAEFFNSAQYPEAVFTTRSIQKTPDGNFEAEGQLSIKDITLPLRFNFQLNNQVLTGTAEIDRLQFSLGTGDWQNTTWVGQFVKVEVTLVYQ